MYIYIYCKCVYCDCICIYIYIMLQIARFLLHELLMRYAGMVDFEYNSGATLDVATSSIRDNLKSLGSYQTTRDTLFGKWKPLQKHSWLFRGCSCTVARCHVLWKFWRSNVSARMAPQSLVQGGIIFIYIYIFVLVPLYKHMHIQKNAYR